MQLGYLLFYLLLAYSFVIIHFVTSEVGSALDLYVCVCEGGLHHTPHPLAGWEGPSPPLPITLPLTPDPPVSAPAVMLKIGTVQVGKGGGGGGGGGQTDIFNFSEHFTN